MLWLHLCHANQAWKQPPFTQRLLEDDPSPETNVSEALEDNILSLLPASRRTREGDVAAPDLSHSFSLANIEDDQALTTIFDWVDQELDLRRLANIHSMLWTAAHLLPPRPLHHQRVLNREIAITERLDLHLVWASGRTFIKPLPRYLLDPRF